MPNQPSISLIYPVYNEVASIADTVYRSVRELESLSLEYEIIVVNDGSNDGSTEVLERLSAELPKLRVVRKTVNQGQGQAILDGFSVASKEFVLHNGIDYPFDLKYLPRLLKHTAKHDIVVASRTSYSGYPVDRVFVSSVNRLLIRICFGLPIKDCNFVQLYRNSALKELDVQSRSAGFVTTELLILSHHSGFRLIEVPIPYEARERGTSRNRRLSVILKSFGELMRFYASRRRRLHRESLAGYSPENAKTTVSKL